MKQIRYYLAMALMTAIAMPMSAQVSNDNEDGVYKVQRPQAKDYVQGEVLFKLKDGKEAKVRRVAGKVQSAGISSLDAVLSEFGVEEMEQLLPQAKVKGAPRRAKVFNGTTIVERDLTQLYKVTLSEEKAFETMQMVEKLKALPEVEYAEPNYKVYLMDANIADNYDSNPYASQQWYLDDYGVKELWNKPIINPKRPVIAIIDTGVDMTHPDLAPNLWTNTAEAEGEANYDNDGNGFAGDVHGWDFINNTPNVKDFNMHGTHVAGIAAAANNGIGIIGANPRALIMPISVMQSDGTGDIATIVKGIDYAAQNGADVINMSLGTYANSRAMRQALEYAYQTTVIVAAAGNDHIPVDPECGLFDLMFPAAYSFVLGVQATMQNGELASFSNFDCNGPNYSSYSTLQDPDGFNYELRAPGTNMLSTIPGGRYKVLQGTSMAAPLVAGAISALTMVKDYSKDNGLHQEILWGDLTHTSNIAHAYAVTKRPAELDMLQIQMRNRKELADETEDDYSGDHEIDAGETVSIYPVIRTTFGAASNIKMHLEMGDEFEDPNTVQITTDQNHKIDFGLHLDAYGRGVSLNPLVMKVADDIADNRHIKLKVVATCDESNETFEWPFTIVVTNMVKIGGVIAEDMTLESGKTYLVNKSLGVLPTATLTIKPGTTLLFSENTGLSNNGTIVAKGTPEQPIVMTGRSGDSWQGIASTTNDVLEYCFISNISSPPTFMKGHFENCIFSDIFFRTSLFQNNIELWYELYFNKCNLVNSSGTSGNLTHVVNTNIIDNAFYFTPPNLSSWYGQNWSDLNHCNFFNSSENGFTVGYYSEEPVIVNALNPSYLGTSSVELAKKKVYDIYTSDYTFAEIDLSNMLTQPVSEAHGIVWKICVNGKDAQDEYEDLAPLGVGKHKFEVYFNRPMNKAVAPRIAFGVRDPYTQNAVSEDGNWNEEGTIYTAYKTITGKTKSDGVNRIYVWGAEDNEYFEIPYEKTRFNFMINAAGSMATGFAAEGKMGRVELTWNNENNDFEDAMGFNIYRFGESYEKQIYNPHYDNNGNYVEYETIMVADTIRINQETVDIETTGYIDYDVTPGETYYYMYKVLSTDLKEYDVSNVVAVTPLTSELGDANGSGDVDVADVITTVNYAAGQYPKPFIFEAADMNTDLAIDILDVVGIIQKILNPSAAREGAMIESTAIYTIEDGMLYVESPVALAGIQAQINLSGELRAESIEFATAPDLDGFEHTSAWLSDNDYLFLAYNMNGKTLSAGKHALLHIGNADLTSLRLSDAQGHNVMVVAGEGTTHIDAMGSKVMTQKGVFNLNGQKVSGSDTNLRKGVYIINGEKVVK